MAIATAPAPHAITGSEKAYVYALGGIARGGATRGNYTARTVFIAIGGVQVGEARPTRDTRVLLESLAIVDTLNEDPNTCTMRTKGFVPAVGADVIITLGSINNGRREFGGRILSTAQVGDQAAINEYAVSAIDYSWGLNTHKVYGRYSGSASDIARTLLAEYAPTYTAEAVEPNLPTVDVITFTAEDLTNALTQLAKRIGAHWYVGYHKELHFGLTDPSATDPRPLTLAHPTGRAIAIRRDASQWVTRGLVEGGGVTALASCAPGETLIPVETTAWYPPGGGTITSGPQRLTYTGTYTGAGGALVGPGGFPAVPAVAALAPGAGAVNPGAHGYAWTFLTASGETLPGPITPITVGPLAGPTIPPTVGAPVVGSGGPSPGTHEWGVSFLTATGETDVAVRVQAATGLAGAPVTAPTPTVQSGGGLDPGVHDYAVTFLTSLGGETTPGPISSPVTATSTTTTTDNAPTPAMMGNGPNSTQGDQIPGNWYGFVLCYSTAAASSDHSAQTAAINFLNVQAQASTAGGGKSSHILVDLACGPAQVKWLHLYRVNQTQKPGNNPPDYRLVGSYANGAVGTTVRHTDTVSDAAIAGAPAPSGTNTVPPVTVTTARVQLTAIPKGGAGITARRIYRRSGGAGLRLLVALGDTTTTSYTDTVPNSSLGASPPAASTAYATHMPLVNLPLGGPLVIGRRIYRAPAGQALRLALQLNDNTTTSYVDTVPDASLGAAPPAASTATAACVQLTQIQPGGAAVTARRVYRTKAGASALLLLTELSDNVTTTYLDAVADAALLGPAPTADTSGLKQPEGSVLAGATAIPCSGVAWALSTGGWAVIGNGQQVVRYTGLAGSSLVGIPASGDGAITATIPFNSSITHAPMIVGIPASGPGAIRFRIVVGDDVNVFAIYTDPASAAALAALIGGDGIQENFLQDRRLSYAEASARAQALVAQHNALDVAVQCTVRDLNARAGRTLEVTLAAPFNLTTTLLIQRATVTYATPGQVPLFAIEASSQRFSFEDLLRTARMTRGT